MNTPTGPDEPTAAGDAGDFPHVLDGMGLQAGRFVLMHPFATLFTKEWEAGRFAELGVKLAERYGVPVVATTGPREEANLAALVQASGGVVQGVSGLPLGELIAWIQACGLYIGNDSGPTHIAAALARSRVSSATLKSSRRGSPSSLSNTFAGLRSRWTTPCSWAWARPSASRDAIHRIEST